MKENYQKLAHLAIRRGVNVQKNQPLVIRAAVRDFEFVRLCMKEAYLAGAKYVEVDWRDEEIKKMDFTYQDIETLSNIPMFLHDREEKRHQDGACYLNIVSDTPGALKEIDGEKLNAYTSAYGKLMKDLQAYTMSNQGQWCVVAIPSIGWAKVVFPDLSDEEAFQKLEDLMFQICRLDGDPMENWQRHDAQLIQHAKQLNAYQFDKLHFTSELGTDIEIQLVENHIWVGGGDETPTGVYFDPNIPTEEVFCMPHREGVNGIVYASKPLSYQGKLIENFWLRFKDGRVEAFDAKKGYDVLEKLLQVDEGSRHLGEVAFVPFDSPISKSGVLFLNTLYDENAACHLALGRPYPENVVGGVDMSEEELYAIGGNDSIQHEDFMFGSEHMNVDGIQKDGTVIAIFRDGNFVI